MSAKNFSFICNGGKWSLAPAYDITYSPGGSNGEHATSLFFSGNPSLELVLKAGTQIYIPEKRCIDSSGLNVPPVSLSNVPGTAESIVPLIAETNVPGVSL